MKLLAIITTVVCTSSALAAALQRDTVTYDETYDNPSASLQNVACSNGDTGLLTLGLHTFSEVPNFPFIGGAPDVSWNSPNCGACYRLRYRQNTIHMTAIDHASNFNIAKYAMNVLTDGRAEELGRVPILAQRVDPSFCGGLAGRISNARPEMQNVGQPERGIDVGQPGRVIGSDQRLQPEEINPSI